MTISEKNCLNDRISKLKDRLNELKNRNILYNTNWNFIDFSIKSAHIFFNQIIDIFIEQCNIFLKDIDSFTKKNNYELFYEKINLLYYKTAHLRECFVYFFQTQFTNRIYIYLFMRDIIDTLSTNNNLKNLNFILIPTGRTATYPIHFYLLGKNYSSWLDFNLIDKINSIVIKEIRCFECDPEEPLERQLIEGHEIFHILLKKETNIENSFKTILSNYKITNLFINNDKDIEMNYIKELFCDFASAWHFGPAYGKAFIEDIAFTTIMETNKHPQRVLRIIIILEALQKHKKHPYTLEVKNFYKNHKIEYSYGVDKNNIRLIIDEYKKILKSLKISYYYSNDLKEKIKNYFEHNLPYLYNDVREFLNNLPNKKNLSNKAQRYYEIFILESIRKNTLWHEFNQEIRKSEELFPIPKAF
ncbi:MAG: hypothetical protein HY934_11175 [Candidatus Firestonebacteria bacterium]|nr:hypothetical protein [Candidatus Firestonebacteria bacterium]